MPHFPDQAFYIDSTSMTIKVNDIHSAYDIEAWLKFQLGALMIDTRVTEPDPDDQVPDDESIVQWTLEVILQPDVETSGIVNMTQLLVALLTRYASGWWNSDSHKKTLFS